jgi:TonB-dependent SusC/RagA subfamily outer membrane receptor
MMSHILSQATRRIAAAAVVIVSVATTSAAAQETGTITGTVTEAGTGRPLAGAQVSISGTTLGTLTGANGRYLLIRVPEGQRTVRVQMIGYSPGEQTVNVTAGESATANFEIAQRAIALDEVVVTGVAGATERRMLGNSIASVNVAEAVERLPISSVDQLLKGRTAGVNMYLSSGTVGLGGQIRIRGANSVALSGNPVIYIDGVRVDGAPDPDQTGVWFGGQDISRIQDLQPSEIDRIEVVKGAAAATLFGTQGANGVIQIFTKRGRTGAPQWSFEVEQGFERTPTERFNKLWPEFVGPTGFRARDPREIVGNGHHHRYTGQVSGGGEGVTYFISGSFQGQENSIAPNANWMNQYAGRANLNAVITPKLSIGVKSGVIHNRLRIPDNDNALHGLFSQVASGLPYSATEDRPWGERFGSFYANQTLENHQSVLRNTTGITVDYRASESFVHQLNLGIDWFAQEQTKFFPYGYEGSGNKLGSKANHTRNFRDITADYRGTLSHALNPNITSALSVGFQGNFTNTIRVIASGVNFPAPGVRTVGAAANTFGDEIRVQEINAGIFFQETVGLWDKLFLTGALRVDGNSAFGNQFHYQAYPKASLAYNISEEGFWPTNLWPTMKLRLAYGASGLAPAQFAADRTYQAISAQAGVPAVTPLNIGNPNLGPEKSEEIEVGFDAGLMDNRLGLELTAYAQRTTNALLNQPFPPSLGFLQTQLTNIGEIQNRGVELGIRGIWVRRDNLEWNTNFQVTAQKNWVADMGGVEPFFVGDARIVEEYPVQGIWAYTLERWDPATRRHTRSDERTFVGQIEPAWFGSFSTDVRMGRFTVSGMTDFQGGNKKINFSKWWGTRVRTGDHYLSLVERPTGAPTLASDSLLNFAQTIGSTAYVEPADFLSLRELALTYQVPENWLGGLGLQRASIRLSGRNVHMWTRFSGLSPETSWRGSAQSIGSSSDFDTQPPSRVFLLTFRTSF